MAELTIKRRSFFKMCGLAMAALFFPKPARAEQIDIPFLPTLKFLQGHNRSISTFNAEYSTRGTWTALAHRVMPKGHMFEEHIIRLHWENGEWFAVDKQWRDDEGRLHYFNKINWPSWLRKF